MRAAEPDDRKADRIGFLEGQTAVVTGAGTGLGRECAIALAAAGATVVLLGRTHRTLEETRNLVTAFGGQAAALICDVTNDDDVRALFASLKSCDVLVNNAGSNVPQPFLEVSPDTLDHLIRLNVRSVFVTCQAAAAKMMRQRSGVIINMSSQMGHVGAPRRTLYCMTKHAVEGLTKALAVELAPSGIRVNSVAPTYVDTPLTRPYLADPQFRADVLNAIPMQRLASSSDVASAVAFLVSPSAAMITGTSLIVDGGYTAQ